MATVILLHTNDIHGHLTGWLGWECDLKDRRVGGLDRLAAAVHEARKGHDGEVLLLDAGDCIGDTMIADRTSGKALISGLNHLGYDAMTVGNHEPDFGGNVLRTRIADAKFPVIAANLMDRRGEKPFTKPYVIRQVGGVSVGIVGVAYPKTTRTTAPKNVAELEFTEPVAAVKECLPKLRREGAEVVVALTHLGLSADKHFAEAVTGIDVIVGGHSHNRMAEVQRVGHTLIVQAGAHGSDLGRLDLTIDKGRITAHRRTLIPLDHAKVPSDAKAARLVHDLLEPHRRTLDEVVGKAAGWLVRAQTIAGQEARKRDEESPVDSLFADILREQTRADVALLPGVGYGVAIPPGPITAAMLRQLVPHDGKVVTMRLSGTRIVEVLEQAVENVFTRDPAVKVGGMVQVSGLRFRYDPSLPRDHRVVHVERTEGRWEPMNDYTVVTNSLLAQGGHNYQSFRHGERRVEHESQYEAIKQWLKDHAAVKTPALGRITKAKAERP